MQLVFIGQKKIEAIPNPSYSKEEAEQSLHLLERQLLNEDILSGEELAEGESFASVVLPENVETSAQRKKRGTKRKMEALYDCSGMSDPPYVPTIESGTGKPTKKARIATETNSIGSGNYQKSGEYHQHNQTSTDHLDENNQIQFVAVASPMSMSAQTNVLHRPNACASTAMLSAEPTGVNNEGADAICITDAFLSSPSDNRTKLPQLIPFNNTPNKALQGNQGVDTSMTGLQLNHHLGESAFIPYNVELQRGLHTPIFDELGNTPIKEFSANGQSGHMQLNDPVLIETASKRNQKLPHYQQLSSEESSNDSTGTSGLEGIAVLQSPSTWMKSLAVDGASAVMPQSTAPLENNLDGTCAESDNTNVNAAAVPMDFQCPFTGDNLTRQVQAVLGSKVEVQYFSNQ